MWCSVFWNILKPCFFFLLLVSSEAITVLFSIIMIKVYMLYHEHSKLAHPGSVFNTLSFLVSFLGAIS